MILLIIFRSCQIRIGFILINKVGFFFNHIFQGSRLDIVSIFFL